MNGTVSGRFDVAPLVSAIREGMKGVGSSGDIVIPIYLGGTMLDEVIVNAQREKQFEKRGKVMLWRLCNI